VIGDIGAVNCRSSKQQIVTKSSTEAELVALSDCANQALFIRNFLIQQGVTLSSEYIGFLRDIRVDPLHSIRTT
jgi:hypothetical protein